MNTVYLSQAEPLLRGAHAATINQKDRDELRAIHCRVLKFMQGTGIFIGEIAPDKTSAPSHSEPLTPDPACPHCHGTGNGIGSVFDRCICTYGGAKLPPIKTSAPGQYKCPTCGKQNHFVNQCGCDPNNLPTRVLPIMDDDDARKHDQKQANATLEHNLACMVSDYENGNIAGGRLRWAAIKADLRGLS